MTHGHLSALETKHADLEHRIEFEEMRPARDDVALHDLKKKKLALKDEIASFRSE